MITVSLVYRQRKPFCVRHNSDITAARPARRGERLHERRVSSSGQPGVAANSGRYLLVSAAGHLPVSVAGAPSGQRLRATSWSAPRGISWSASSGRRGREASQVPGVTWRSDVPSRPRSPRPATRHNAPPRPVCRHNVKVSRLYAGRCEGVPVAMSWTPPEAVAGGASVSGGEPWRPGTTVGWRRDGTDAEKPATGTGEAGHRHGGSRPQSPGSRPRAPGSRPQTPGSRPRARRKPTAQRREADCIGTGTAGHATGRSGKRPSRVR